ncbi:MAG TPA: PIN domain-containing protein [Candidatus Udaeobacter sp.]|nr:PIN domain-containing protein [Candidatus Udaeobacter sp.]
MKILLDTDVLMDVALGRPDFGPDSRAVLDWCQQTPGTAVVAWHTVSNLFYLIHAARSDSFARSFLSDLLKFASVATSGTEAVRNALTMRMSDFEDALQAAAAISGNAEYIVTRNTADYRHSPIPAITPRDFLRRFVSQRK